MSLPLLVLCVLLFTFSDYFAMRWGISQGAASLLFVLIVGPFAYLVFGYLAANTSLVKMGGYVNSGIVLATTFAGVVFFGKRLSRTSWVGILVIAIGITMLSLGKISRES